MTNDELHEQTQRWLRGENSAHQVKQTIRKLLFKLVEEEPADPGPELHSRGLKTTCSEDYADVVARATQEAQKFHMRLVEEKERTRSALERYLEQGMTDTSDLAELTDLQAWTFVHGLVIEPWEIDHPNPQQATQLARRGAELAENLDRAFHGERRVRDLRALAYAKLGNALRIQSEFRRAERAFSKAAEELAQGTDDSLVAARVQLAEASFHGGQGRFEQAFQLLRKVMATARRFGDTHLLGKALISRAFFKSNAGQTERGLRLLHRGLRFIDPAREPRLVLVAWHNLILTLTYQDRYHEAAERLPYIQSLHKKFGNKLDSLRLRWVEARIDLARGNESRAENVFEEIRERFLEVGVGFDAALVSLDLAHVYARQGRGEDMRNLAQEMIPIFESRDMHREAIAALLVFKKATEMDQVSVHLVEDLTAFLRRSRGNPKLRFRPPF